MTWTAACACGGRPSCCMFSSRWTFQSHLIPLASPAGGLTFNYQQRGSMSQLHSGRHICFPVPLQHDLEGHREAQIGCKPLTHAADASSTDEAVTAAGRTGPNQNVASRQTQQVSSEFTTGRPLKCGCRLIRSWCKMWVWLPQTPQQSVSGFIELQRALFTSYGRFTDLTTARGPR